MRIAAAPLIAILVLAAFSSVATADEKPSYRVLGSDKGKVVIVDPSGRVVWEVKNPSEVHDLAMLPDGNVMFTTSGPKVVEMTPAKEIVWSFASKPAGANKGRVEVHAFQRLP